MWNSFNSIEALIFIFDIIDEIHCILQIVNILSKNHKAEGLLKQTVQSCELTLPGYIKLLSTFDW